MRVLEQTIWIIFRINISICRNIQWVFVGKSLSTSHLVKLYYYNCMSEPHNIVHAQGLWNNVYRNTFQSHKIVRDPVGLLNVFGTRLFWPLFVPESCSVLLVGWPLFARLYISQCFSIENLGPLFLLWICVHVYVHVNVLCMLLPVTL